MRPPKKQAGGGVPGTQQVMQINAVRANHQFQGVSSLEGSKIQCTKRSSEWQKSQRNQIRTSDPKLRALSAQSIHSHALKQPSCTSPHIGLRLSNVTTNTFKHDVLKQNLRGGCFSFRYACARSLAPLHWLHTPDYNPCMCSCLLAVPVKCHQKAVTAASWQASLV